MSKAKLIEFSIKDPRLSVPKPAKAYIPEWYKKSPMHTDYAKEHKVGSPERSNNKGIKYCMPFLDGLTHGYIAETWCDIQVYRTPSGPEIHWEVDPDIISSRDKGGNEFLPVPVGHVDKHYVWKNPYGIQTPRGYSCLLTHPLNRYDLPFTTMSAIVDSDTYTPPGNYPFYLHEDFEGIIPAGTPMFQIIPIKRDSWTSELNEDLYEVGEKRNWIAMGQTGFYKNFLWTKKSFD